MELGRAFRAAYVGGLKRLLRHGKLKLGGSVAGLEDAAAQKQLLDKLESTDWNVFIEGPPKGVSDARNVVKYLARYISGGPIANGRIIGIQNSGVTFWARPKRSNRKHRGMNRPEPYRISGVEFVRRLSLHILPRGFTRCRRYGGFHNHNRADYIARSQRLLATPALNETIPDVQETSRDNTSSTDSSSGPTCPNCEMATTLVSQRSRPSWREIFNRVSTGRAPPC